MHLLCINAYQCISNTQNQIEKLMKIKLQVYNIQTYLSSNNVWEDRLWTIISGVV
jgi:hypothetical protein